jgi:hypothetical protein
MILSAPEGFNCRRFFLKVLMTLLGHFKLKLAG